MSKRTYRSSQLITPYGPGAIIDIGEESLVLSDPLFWPKQLKEIKLERLTKATGVWALKKPPVDVSKPYQNTKSSNALMTVRFPEWMFCPRCRKMTQHSQDTPRNDEGVPICSNTLCQKKVLVPMRFVAACKNGHLQDVPWVRWAHNGGRICENPDLYFETVSNNGSGLNALKICCKNPSCQAERTLHNLMQPDVLGATCADKQPWEYHKKRKNCHCEEIPQVLQRGASNVYFPAVCSALDIPYSSENLENPIYKTIKDTDDFADLLKAIKNGKEKRVMNIAEDLADEFGYTVENIIKAAKGQNNEKRKFQIPDDGELRSAEWIVFNDKSVEKNCTQNFLVHQSNWQNKQTFGFEKIIERVLLVDKLREVRAFLGFQRISPDGKLVNVKTSIEGSQTWLPATEVFGEGIFIQFKLDAIVEWKDSFSQDVKKRIADFENRHAQLQKNHLPVPTAEFLLLHTFAHLLIRQLSFESGYSSGSLRERIYAENGQAGVLIYTADGDSEGSLGGLVQQGEPERLFPAIIAALETAHWCSNDPVCSEMDAQGVMNLNKSACHSCVLLSETSCEYNNSLLDRALLIGDTSNNWEGFFSSLIEALSREF